MKNKKKEYYDTLCSRLRKEIIEAVNNNGGHPASNLGAVELTVALHETMDLPADKIIFDVGHQAYAHKILSGRSLEKLRSEEGVSGFCDIRESAYDSYGSGHSGSAISAAAGMRKAREQLGEKYRIAVVLGDGALTSGETLEALNGIGNTPGQLLLVLNDNGMSISAGNGGFYRHLSRLTLKKGYRATKTKWKKSLNKTAFGRLIFRSLSGMKRFIKRTAGGTNLFEEMGIKYVGVVDGHDVSAMMKTLPDLLECEVPVLLHVRTRKGKGYPPAERDPEKYHGVSAGFGSGKNDFADSVGDILTEIKRENPRFTAITAAMNDGTGTTPFGRVYPESLVDVGICEQTAVSYACGASLCGLIPAVFVYSTFMQRAFDQIEQEVCLQKLPVILCMDRAGLVGRDGKTHQGLFDIAMLRALPDISIFAPDTPQELKKCMEYAITLQKPTAIRYPNGTVGILTSSEEKQPPSSALLRADSDTRQNNRVYHIPLLQDVTKWQTIRKGESDTIVLTAGPRMLEQALIASDIFGGKPFTVVECTCIRPLDHTYLDGISGKNIITMEEGVYEGGFGSAVCEYFADANTKTNVRRMAVKDVRLPPCDVQKQILSARLDALSLIEAIKETEASLLKDRSDRQGKQN